MQHAPKRPKLFALGEGPMGRKGLRIWRGGVVVGVAGARRRRINSLGQPLF